MGLERQASLSLMSALTQVCTIRQLCHAFALCSWVCLPFLWFRTKRKPRMGLCGIWNEQFLFHRVTMHPSLPQISLLIAPFFLLWKISTMVSLSKTQGTLHPRNPGFPAFIRLLVCSCGSLRPSVKGPVTWLPFPFLLWENQDTRFPAFN